MSNYFYNGVELPELPEWDKTTYPHALIYQVNASIGANAYYMLVVSANRAIVREGENYLTGKTYPTLEIDGVYNDYLLSDTWQQNSVESDGHLRNAESISNLWTNTDIYYADDYSIDESLAGTLYLAASEPVLLVPTLTASDLYKKVNGQLVKHTLYKKVGGKLVKYDEYVKE